MVSFLCMVAALIGLALMYCGLSVLKRIERKVNRIMTQNSELAGKLDALGTQLDKAQAEILAEIDVLKNTAGQLPPDAEASLARLTAKVQGLDDLNPDASPTA